MVDVERVGGAAWDVVDVDNPDEVASLPKQSREEREEAQRAAWVRGYDQCPTD